MFSIYHLDTFFQVPCPSLKGSRGKGERPPIFLINRNLTCKIV